MTFRHSSSFLLAGVPTPMETVMTTRTKWPPSLRRWVTVGEMAESTPNGPKLSHAPGAAASGFRHVGLIRIRVRLSHSGREPTGRERPSPLSSVQRFSSPLCLVPRDPDLDISTYGDLRGRAECFV